MNKYYINDLDKFAYNLRENVAKSFSEDYTENLDDFISINQVIQIIAENSEDKTENDQMIISEENFNNIFDSIRVFLQEVALAKLAANGDLECCWNDQTNEMEFWVSQNAR